MNEQNPLVSIIVITYNSSKFVLETLESAKAQTYQNIELIVSDDCSTDNTVEICRQWVEENKERFVRTELVTAPQNTGIPANCNRGVKAAQGEWVKLIAGDDLLLDKCIALNIENITKYPLIKVQLSRIKRLKNGVIFHTQLPIGIKANFNFVNAYDQHRALIIRYFGNTPSMFISKDIVDRISFDERFKFLEDYPFALNVTKAGFSFSFLDQETVIYRIHDDSVMNPRTDKIFSEFYKKRFEFDKIYRFPFMPKNLKRRELFEYNRLLFLEWIGLNKNTFFNRLINSITYRMNPFLYL